VTRDELTEAAIKVCIEAVRTGGVVSETLLHAQGVCASLAALALEAGAHLAQDRARELARLRKRRQRERDRAARPPVRSVRVGSRSTRAKTPESSVNLRDGHGVVAPAGSVTERDCHDTAQPTAATQVFDTAPAGAPFLSPTLSRSSPAKTRDSSVTGWGSSRARACASDPDPDLDPNSEIQDSERREQSQIAREAERDASRVTAAQGVQDAAGLAVSRAPYPEPQIAPQDRCERLKRIWERVAHAGRSVGDTPGIRALLQGLLPAIDARDASEPDALFERVLQVYTSRKHRQRKQPLLHHFCADFAALADQMALERDAPPRSPPTLPADKLKGLVSALHNARAWREDASDRHERAYAGFALARAEDELVAEFGREALARTYAQLEREAS